MPSVPQLAYHLHYLGHGRCLMQEARAFVEKGRYMRFSLSIFVTLASAWIFSLPLIGNEAHQDHVTLAAPPAQLESTQTIEQHPITVGLELKYAPLRFDRYHLAPEKPAQENGNAALIAVEWLLVQKLGKVGLGLETGFFAASHQRIDEHRIAHLYAIPALARLSYHFDYFSNQLLVPFASVGAGLTFLRQVSSTGANIAQTQTYQGWEYTIGGQLCLNSIDPYGSRAINRNLGINNTYLLFEFTQNQPAQAGQMAVLSYQVYRFGLRLEI